MKLRFLSVISLLFFARGCDIYSTTLWIFDEGGMDKEMNPLIHLFGLGWNGLILFNIIITVLIASCYYFYTFKYKLSNELPPNLNSLSEFVSVLYFKKKNKFWKLLYSLPKDKKLAAAHSGYILIWVVIFTSLFAATHNSLSYYNVPIYRAYEEVVIYSGMIVYVFALFLFFYYTLRIWRKEYQIYLKLKR